MSAQPAQLILGPCSVLVDPASATTVTLQTNGRGYGSALLPIPDNRWRLGRAVFARAVALDISGPTLAIVMSAGARVAIGR